MPQSQQRPLLGFLLAFNTVVFWGALPIAQKVLIQVMDPYTITWYRFLSASVFLLIVITVRKRLPSKSVFTKKVILLLIIATFGLNTNYILYLIGLKFIEPAHTQVIIQTAPLFFSLGSMYFFKERFNSKQWFGFGILNLGFILFFNKKLLEFFSNFDDYFFGTLIIVLAAFAWAFYAITQKRLLRDLSSQNIMMIIYIGCTISLSPFIEPSSISKLSKVEIWILAFCALNTLLAYGSFAEALAHWEATKVSAVLAITPIMTFIFVGLTNNYFPEMIHKESFDLLVVLGAFLVVLGSMAISLSKNKNEVLIKIAPLQT